MKTILMVEDQLEFRAIHTAFLQHHGYRVVAAENGAEGVAAAREEQPDLILMDFSIPGMDGIAATQELKRNEATREIPILLVTAHSYGAVGKRAKQAGCEEVLAKPCEPERVLREVRQRIG